VIRDLIMQIKFKNQFGKFSMIIRVEKATHFIHDHNTEEIRHVNTVKTPEKWAKSQSSLCKNFLFVITDMQIIMLKGQIGGHIQNRD